MAVGEDRALGGNLTRPELVPGAWDVHDKSRAKAEIIYGKRLQPHQLQGQGPQMQAPQMQAAQANPALLAQRQKMIQGQRDDLSRRATAQGQMADDAINRRFSQMGMSGSGAGLRAQLQAQGGIADQTAGQMAQLGEREAGFQMSAEEAQAAREQAAAQANMQGQTQAGMANLQNAMQERMYNVEQLNKAEALNEASALQRAGMLLDLDTTEFNKGVSKSQGGGGK